MSMKAAISELAAATLLAAGDAAAQSRTTTPGVVYVLTVLLMDTSILVTPNMCCPKRTIRYPRRALIRYAVTTRAQTVRVPPLGRYAGGETGRPRRDSRQLELPRGFAYESSYRGSRSSSSEAGRGRRSGAPPALARST